MNYRRYDGSYRPKHKATVVPLPHDQENGWVAYCSVVSCGWEHYDPEFEMALEAARSHERDWNGYTDI